MDEETLKKLHKIEVEILDEIVRICDKNNIDYFLVGGTLLGAVRHKGFIPWDDDIDIGMTRKDFKKFIECASKDLDSKYNIQYKDTNKEYYLNFIKIMKNNTIFEENDKIEYKGEKGIFVDIFPFDNTNNRDSLVQFFQAKLSNLIRSILYIRIGIKSKNPFKKIIKNILFFIPNQKLLNVQEKVMSLNKNDNSKYLTAFSGTYSYKKDTYLREKMFPLKKLSFEGKEYKVLNDYKYYLENLYGDNYMELPPVEKRKTHNPNRIKF